MSRVVCLNINRANYSNLIFLTKHSLPVPLYCGVGRREELKTQMFSSFPDLAGHLSLAYTTSSVCWQ